MVTPVGIEPTPEPISREVSLFYTNPIQSRLILHRAMTGLESKWWPATRPTIRFCSFSITIPSFPHALTRSKLYRRDITV